MSQTGALDVDQRDGTVYISGNDGQLAVGNRGARTSTANLHSLSADPNDG
jgi:hypothetical protein